jgi:2-polyprenyl-3-methyl-5-hydroxy-6-metoxy-1,4-benzoquinol methylase
MINDYYARDVYTQLLKNSCNFINKNCLDIGTRNGANCENLVRVGASSVVGIDIDSSRFDEMWVNKKITLLKQDLLTMDNSNKFDVITCFLWNMPYLQYTNTMNKIKELLNPDGLVYIGIADEVYKCDPPGSRSVNIVELLKKHFNNTRILDTNCHQWIIEAKNPF